MKENTQSEEFMMNKNDETFFATLQQKLQQDLPEPPAQLDSFIKAAARQQLKKKKTTQNKQFILWSCGIAAAFAVSFSCLYFYGMQEPVTDNVTPVERATAVLPAASQNIAQTTTDLTAPESAWADFFTEISDLSSEINETDMEVSVVAAYTAFDF